jgi:hypothetical protein
MTLGWQCSNDFAKSRTIIQNSIFPAGKENDHKYEASAFRNFLKKTYFSRSSVISPNGLHSNTIKPGYPLVDGPATEETGMEKTDSEAHDPEAGTSNLRSSHMAVASLSGFIESQICQGSFSVDGLRVLTCLRMTSRNDPCAHLSSWSLRFCERKTERKRTWKIHQDHDTREIGDRLMCTSFNRLASSSSVRNG